MRLLLLVLCACSVLGAADGALMRDNVVIILDGSGSMDKAMRDGTTRIAAAKKAINTVVDASQPQTAIGLVAFASSSVKVLAPLSTGDRSTVLEAVNRLQHRGKTPLGEALRVAGDMLLDAREQQYGYGTYTLLVVTDGEASDDQAMRRYAPEIVARGIRMDVIGVDMKSNHSLKVIAHRYSSAADADSLGAAVASTFAEIGGGGGDAAEEDFALVNDLYSDDGAQVMLGALTKQDNRKLGSVSIAMPAAVSASSRGDQTPQPAGGNSGSQQANSDNGGFGFGWIIAVVAVFIIFGRGLGRR